MNVSTRPSQTRQRRLEIVGTVGQRGLDPSSIRSAEGVRYLAAWPTPALAIVRADRGRDIVGGPIEHSRHSLRTRPVAFVLEAIVCRQVTLSSSRLSPSS